MKIELNISQTSQDVCMGKCPECLEWQCGINYRTT